MRLHIKIKIKNILNIAIPSGLQGGLDVILVSFAILFVGSISSSNVGALGIGLGYILIFYPISSIFYVGTNIGVSRNFGAKNIDNVEKIFSTMFFTSILASVPTIILGYFFMEMYANFMSLSNNLRELFFSYCIISLFSFPANMAKNVVISAFAAIGDTKRPFNIKIIMCCFSIFLNYSLILGHFGFPQMGLRGAAISSVVVHCLELALLILLVKYSKTSLKLRFYLIKDFMLKGLKVGAPTGMERLFTIFSIAIVLRFISSYSDIFGDSVLVGYQVGARIETLSFVPSFGFSVAIMSLVSQSIGARKYRRMQEYLKITIIISTIMFSLVGLLLALFSLPLSNLLIKNDSVAIDISIAYLVAVGLSQAPQILSFVLDGALRGSGKTQIPLFINVGSIIVFRFVPMFICVNLGLHLYFIFSIIFIETYIRSLIFYFTVKFIKLY